MKRPHADGASGLPMQFGRQQPPQRRAAPSGGHMSRNNAQRGRGAMRGRSGRQPRFNSRGRGGAYRGGRGRRGGRTRGGGRGRNGGRGASSGPLFETSFLEDPWQRLLPRAAQSAPRAAARARPPSTVGSVAATPAAPLPDALAAAPSAEPPVASGPIRTVLSLPPPVHAAAPPPTASPDAN